MVPPDERPGPQDSAFGGDRCRGQGLGPAASHREPRAKAEPGGFTTERYLREMRDGVEVREARAYAERQAAHPAAPASQAPAPGPAVREPPE